MLASFWAARARRRRRDRLRGGDRTFAEVNANANRLVRALRARGVQAGDGVALLCANRPEFVETVAAAQRAGLRLTTDQLAPHRRRGRLHRRRLRSDRVRRRRAVRRDRGARRADLAPRLRACVAVGGDDRRASSRGTTCSRPKTATDIDDPDARRARCSTRRARPAGPKGVRRAPDPRGALDVAQLTQYRARPSRASVHRPAVPRRAARVLARRAGVRWACRSC